ncbi:MAG: penicillin-binding protein [Flavobacteriales bacterium]
MPIEDKNILNRLYIIVGCMLIFAIIIVVKLVNIQFVEGNKYKELAHKNTTRNFTIPASRGNLYADDGSLLATSVPKYDIRFDAVTVSSANFNKHLPALSKAMHDKFGKSTSFYQNLFKKARTHKNRYLLVATNLGYSDYMKVKNFPLFNLGPYKGGIIVEQRTVREHPLGKIGERTVGNEQKDTPGYYAVGLEGAFQKFLKGKDGKRLKQKIAKGQWKPVYDENEVEPQDGFDVISTINVNIQDIAHHALLKQLKEYEADHGCVIVMDVKTGAIKAVSNLKKTKDGNYYEARNYAVWEAHEPGSTFKVMALMAALEDRVIDTSTVIDTKNGVKTFYGRKIYDSHRGGFGKISAAQALVVSSNIGLATIIDEAYAKHPNKFINRLKKWGLNDTIGIPIKGESKPMIPEPGHSKWSKNALPSLAYGYNLKLTPLQTLTFYNAIANGGKKVKPKFVNEIRAWNQPIKIFKTEVMNEHICSSETLSEIQDILKNIVIRGTGKKLYSPYFSMAGKTGTAQTEYWMPDWKENKRYISTFAGYFPAENPKYSCIVVIHKPSLKKGYYGADVSGPVFKRIAQKIFTDAPLISEISTIKSQDKQLNKDYETYYELVQKNINSIPNVIGMAGMDAISLLENLGLNVKVYGVGKVAKQSLKKNTPFKKGQQIILNLS